MPEADGLSPPPSAPVVAFDAATLRGAPRRLRTPRLVLLTPAVEHAAALVDLFNASLPAWRFIDWPKHPRDLAWGERFCAGGLGIVDSAEGLIFNVFRQAADTEALGACIGRIDLHSFDFETPRCEIGYVGDPRVSGQGLLREAVLAVVELGFRLGLVRIEAFSDFRNERAVRFALGLGFRREGVVRHRERDPEGELCEQVLLARLPADTVPPAVAASVGEPAATPGDGDGDGAA